MTDHSHDRKEQSIILDNLRDTQRRLDRIEDSGLALVLVDLGLALVADYLDQRWFSGRAARKRDG